MSYFVSYEVRNLREDFWNVRSYKRLNETYQKAKAFLSLWTKNDEVFSLLNQILMNKYCTDEILSEIYSSCIDGMDFSTAYELIYRLVNHPNFENVQHLSELSKNSSSDLRYQVLSNRHLPIDDVRRLTEDSNSLVKLRAIQVLKERTSLIPF